MKQKERDILAEKTELKNMAYHLPKGYFDEFKLNMKPPKEKPALSKAKPYLYVAASFAVLVAAGLALLRPALPDDEFTQEDFLVFSESMINTEYYEYSTDQYAEAEIANDDIIDYLIYSGITAEEIEQLK